jgi:hypothetical protein
MIKRIFWLLFAASFTSYANDDALSIDRVVPQNFELAFPNESNIQPEQSDFKINSFALMSNDEGERWAVVTATNLASGKRSLSQKHIMAIVANGKRVAPSEFLYSFNAHETLSLTINFGESKFPLLSVYSRANN